MLVEVAILSFVTASISFTVTESKAFEKIRDAVKLPFFSGVLNCGYCFGHWVAFVLVAIYKPKLLESFWLLDYFLTALVIAWFGAFQWSLFCWLIGKAE